MARKILLADDSVTAQNMGRRILADAGYDVTTVNNGSAALKKIAEQLPELIVLDVYMPGYSGLEVCQRLKETRETARIPVLLTVGKLEPFKAEDARRARADAFIIKPFEASELLTALTKLEDKIVPQPSGKGSFAKVWADLEKGSDGKTERFGDAETGWKDRLIIPSGSKKKDEPEEDDVSAKAKDSKGKKGKEKKKEEDLKPLEVKAPVEVMTAAGVPADITPEEVAAIAAAAAAFEEKTQPPADFAVNKSEVPEPAAAVVTATIQPDSVETKPVEAQAKESETVNQILPAAATASPAVESAAEIKLAEPANAAKETASQVAVTDLKVAETVAAAFVSQPVAEVGSAQTIEKPAEVLPVPGAAASIAAPRWEAKEIPLPPEETGISLEQEMHKATAVLQAATAMVDLSAMANPAPVEAVSQVAAAKAKVEVEEKEEIKQHGEPSEARVEEATASTTTPEPSRPQEPAAAVSQPELQPEMVTAVAAAASAGPSAPESRTEAISHSISASEPSELAGSVPEVKAHESELAAAWAQWKQIRETVVGSQLTSQIADAAAAELQNFEPPQKSSEEEPAGERPSSNPTAIASIVDSVLAELKPKLVEEIARKLGDEKRKKK